MFTGLIRECARTLSYKGNILWLSAQYRPNIGDSIAVNGACLTVVEAKTGGFKVELSHESRETLATENFKGLVHIEPAMVIGSRVDGHLLQGHVDAVGEITSIEKDENATNFFVKTQKDIMKFISPKGSIAIDGVSLTVNDVGEDDTFRLTIISHTMRQTLFSAYKVGRRVNIETDMIARYLFNFAQNKDGVLKWNDVDRMVALY
ncbi:MAG: riboflavin synthase [Campylobacteraceae bacterium]|jgi:riboflavin synthase|nr:riboflavin synthase [Campylobacteraceae bacterium]